MTKLGDVQKQTCCCNMHRIWSRRWRLMSTTYPPPPLPRLSQNVLSGCSVRVLPQTSHNVTGCTNAATGLLQNFRLGCSCRVLLQTSHNVFPCTVSEESMGTSTGCTNAGLLQNFWLGCSWRVLLQTSHNVFPCTDSVEAMGTPTRMTGTGTDPVSTSAIDTSPDASVALLFSCHHTGRKPKTGGKKYSGNHTTHICTREVNKFRANFDIGSSASGMMKAMATTAKKAPLETEMRRIKFLKAREHCTRHSHLPLQ